MNRTQKFALNSITSMIVQIVTLLVGLITPRLLIETYGSEVNGLVSSLNQFISYITLVEAGIGGAAIFSLYAPLHNSETKRISSIVVAAKQSYLQAGYLFSTGIFILALVYACLKDTETLSFWMIFGLTIILAVNSFADFFFVSGRRVLLSADQREYVISIASIVNIVVRNALIFIMATNRVDVMLVYAISASAVIIKIIIIYLYSRKLYPYLDHTASPDNGALKMRYDVVYQQVLGMIQTGAPVVLATILLDLTVVSVYSVYNMVVAGLNAVLSVFVIGLPAGFGDLIASKEKHTLQKTVIEFEVAYYYMLSIVYGLALVLIMPFIGIYTQGLTDANYYNVALGVAIVANGVWYNIKTPQSMLIQSAGLYKETRWRSTWQAVIILIAGFVLGYCWGIVGILLGSIISNIFRTIDLMIFIPKNVTQNSILHTAKRISSVFLNIGVIAIPSIFIRHQPGDYFEWLLMTLCYGVYAFVVTTITSMLLERAAFQSVCKRVVQVLCSRK